MWGARTDGRVTDNNVLFHRSTNPPPSRGAAAALGRSPLAHTRTPLAARHTIYARGHESTDFAAAALQSRRRRRAAWRPTSAPLAPCTNIGAAAPSTRRASRSRRRAARCAATMQRRSATAAQQQRKQALVHRPPRQTAGDGSPDGAHHGAGGERDLLSQPDAGHVPPLGGGRGRGERRRQRALPGCAQGATLHHSHEASGASAACLMLCLPAAQAQPSLFAAS